MRMKLYNFLVNRHGGIRNRYHSMHDNSGKLKRTLSYLYLLWLNFCYYVLQCRFLGKEKGLAVYEEKRLPFGKSESEMRMQEGIRVEETVCRLLQYDVISFDIFDTMIFRPFSDPTDLFHFIGAELGLLDIKRIRTEQEAAARRICYQKNGHYEVSFFDIWKQMEREKGIDAQKGMQLEMSLERQFCYANPFMLEVYRKLKANGKKSL